MTRSDNRRNDELRPLILTLDFAKNADGSVLVELGNTKVSVTAGIEEKVPQFLEGTNKGWLTAEYSLLPGSTRPRNQREVSRGRPSSRTSEIQRLIGRSLRAAFDLSAIGQRTITIDADVINADGSTRVASISGGYIAAYKALSKLKDKGVITKIPLIEPIAAVSVGVIGGELLLDLNYIEDSKADLDCNVVMNKSGKIIELQMTAEGKPFDLEFVNKLIQLASKGIKEIIEKQRQVTEIVLVH